MEDQIAFQSKLPAAPPPFLTQMWSPQQLTNADYLVLKQNLPEKLTALKKLISVAYIRRPLQPTHFNQPFSPWQNPWGTS